MGAVVSQVLIGQLGVSSFLSIHMGRKLTE
jgi:hypothetical protein